MGHLEGLHHLFGVPGLVVLEQRPLEGLALGGLFHKYRLEGVGVEAGVEHTGADGAGGGVKVLDLLGPHVVFVEVLGQIDRVLEGAARVAGHEVGHQVLLFARLLAQLVELILELVKDLDGGFAHIGQGVGGAVLGGHLQLARDVVLHQLFEEGLVRVGHQVVKPDAAADEHLFDPGQLAHPAQNLEVVAVVHDQVGAGLGRQAVLAAGAHSLEHLFPAGGEPEVRRRAADVVDIALEVGLVGHPLGLGHNAVGAAAGDPAALVELDGAEVAPAEAPTVLDDGELHLPDGGHAPHGLIDRVIPPGIGQGVNFIQLPPHQGFGGQVLDEILLALFLDDDLAADHILVVHLDPAGLGVGHFIRGDLFVPRALHIPGGQVVEVGHVAGAVHVGDGLDGFPGGQAAGDLHRLVLPHAEADQVRPRVLGDAGQDGVQPVVVMGEPPEGGFQPAQDYRQVGVGLFGQFGVDGGAPVGAGPRLAAGGIFVLGPGDLGHRVVADHAVHVAAADEKAVFGFAEPLEVLAVGIPGLGQHPHPVALGLQKAADDGGAEAGVVHIGVAAHHHEIQLVPAPPGHVLPADGQKLGVLGQGGGGFLFCHRLVLILSSGGYSSDGVSGWFRFISSHC